MSADGNEAVTICHSLNLSHRLRDSQPVSRTTRLKLEIIRPAPGDKLSPGIYT